jgi:hypothetical protein
MKGGNFMFNYVWIVILLFIVIFFISKCIHDYTFMEQVFQSLIMTISGLFFGSISGLIIATFIASICNFCANYNLFGLVAQTEIHEIILGGGSVGTLIGGIIGFVLSFIIEL